MQVYTIIATWFGCGNVSKAPGTVASLATILLAPAIVFNNLIGMLLLTLVLIIGLLATSRYLVDYPDVIDPQEVVIDEVIGQLIAFTIPIIFFRYYNYIPATFCTSYILYYFSIFSISFIFFRAFDITKIWPINVIERIPGTFGIILDDILAGIMSSVCTIFIITQVGT
ncbi:phosphatidylglycerophosphatase A [Ehrlichia ruminantium]|uniref:phosphatidylglycerophosphatase A family protein n=1 Tax=Ehrlichia ruminantium TaxID=779 RepID=UPI0007C11811|nr:phosphatidylglycerophosphatase A [Ehrlichia ruminantium]QLK52124.1 phosphatidylglycerophosphatase A [Ehrlichia ruminantium]QLK53955.1 phosphatidylglycerophosphatase A [Ehrlichia ruminantium]QLK56705.1 phosphatidylglycerophosphatase A [Ehrlichia ruminantium]GAT76013.1 phosphatidylglycerophosphatase A [Ehrlichia ruminantium]